MTTVGRPGRPALPPHHRFRRFHSMAMTDGVREMTAQARPALAATRVFLTRLYLMVA